MVVEDLTNGDRVISELRKMLGHGHGFRIDLPEFLTQAPHSGRVGSHPQHDARTGRCAGRGLAVSPRENERFPGQLIDVGRLDLGVTEASQFGPQVIDDDEEDVGIAKAVIALAKSLKLSVIAEGVETQEQRDFLVEHGCENIQGYFYSKPLLAHEMEKLFLK